MTGRELIRKTFRREKTDRVPWVPFAGVHAGKLKGFSAREVYADGAKLVASLTEAHRIYRPDGMPVLFDLQLEAEALGCSLLWADDSPPTVTDHPLGATSEVPDRIPGPGDGRFPMVLEAMRSLRDGIGEETALYGLPCGFFTLASHLRGTELFMDMILDPDYVHRLLAWTAKVMDAVADLYIDAGMEVIAPVDPLVSQISPDHFQEFLAGPYRKFFDRLRGRGVLSSFFVCGNAIRNLPGMCGTGPDGISIDENIPMTEAKAITDRYDVVLGGNIPLTSVMLFGTQQDTMKYVVDLLDSVDHRNLIVSPGCDMPYDLPPENVIAAEQAVHNTGQVRTMIADYEAPQNDTEVAIPDYSALKRPLVEVFTLDSATCAACTYMYQSALDAKKALSDTVDVVEYKYTSRENVTRVRQMGVKNLPSIYINGQLVYSSIIPSREALLKEIEARR